MRCSARGGVPGRLAYGKCLNLLLRLLTNLPSANRIFVQRGVIEVFTKKPVVKASLLKTGPGLDASTPGPLVNKAAVQKVAEHVYDAIGK